MPCKVDTQVVLDVSNMMCLPVPSFEHGGHLSDSTKFFLDNLHSRRSAIDRNKGVKIITLLLNVPRMSEWMNECF